MNYKTVVDWERLRRDIRTLGMKTFVKYYDAFENKSISEIKEIFREDEKWGDNSINTKASMGKKFFKTQNQKQALELILSSNSGEYTVEKAAEIYTEKYPGIEIEKIRFIRPEFIFGKEIIKKLFHGYAINEQHKVDSYIIDWYIPDLKIAIEFDEEHHSRNAKKDKKRQEAIEKALGCKFLRYKF